jgi:hypothetical protein
MGRSDRSGSSDRINWPVRLAGGVGAAAGFVLGGVIIGAVGLDGFWPGVIAAGGGAGAGVLFGQFVGSRIFRRPQDSGPRA